MVVVVVVAVFVVVYIIISSSSSSSSSIAIVIVIVMISVFEDALEACIDAAAFAKPLLKQAGASICQALCNHIVL